LHDIELVFLLQQNPDLDEENAADFADSICQPKCVKSKLGLSYLRMVGIDKHALDAKERPNESDALEKGSQSQHPPPVELEATSDSMSIGLDTGDDAVGPNEPEERRSE